MLQVTSFAAFRPADDLISTVATLEQVAAPRVEIEKVMKDDPFSILHVLRPEVDLPEGASSEEVEAQAADAFSVFCRHEILQQDALACVYVYQLQREEAIRTGVVMGCSFADVGGGRLKAEARAAAMKLEAVERWERLQGATGAQFRPVTVVVPDDPLVDALVAEVVLMSPLCEVTTGDGVVHRLWGVPGEGLTDYFKQAVGAASSGVLVDGFEEMEGLLRLQKRAGGEEDAIFMAFFVPASQVGLGGQANGGRAKLEPCAGLLVLKF